MKLFPDVDGVPIGSPTPGSDERCPASHALAFLEFATAHCAREEPDDLPRARRWLAKLAAEGA